MLPLHNNQSNQHGHSHNNYNNSSYPQQVQVPPPPQIGGPSPTTPYYTSSSKSSSKQPIPNTYTKENSLSSSPPLFSKALSYFRLILSDPSSRNLLFFLCLNLSFAFVELFYGIWTNSLGLISDSFHMFFDCTGLVAGLVASIITKWRSTQTYTYGYVRAEVLAGFVNGLFLLFIAFFILSEAAERIMEPPEVKHERLFVVSVLGFLVNLVGIWCFGHGHGHSHGGDGHHGHGHSHGGSSSHGHSHDNHGLSNGSLPHSHSSTTLLIDDSNIPPQNTSSSTPQNSIIMQGVFLHILADTLGSVGVIISAILMHLFGWMIADPICSLFIAVMICLSVVGLIRDSLQILMQRSPPQLDHLLPLCYEKIKNLDGVISVHETHFWTLCSDRYVGVMKLEVEKNADARYIVSQVNWVLGGVGVREVTVQLDFSAY